MTTLHSTSRITNFNHPGQPALDHAFGYDAVDRINQEVDTIGASLWTYDLNGNRLSSQPGSNTYTYTYPASSNRLQSVSGPVSKTYTYDAAGNPASDGTTAFTFNAAGRLSKVVRSGQTNQYYHNALGERVLKSGAYLVNGPWRFMYDSEGHLIGEYDRNNTLRQETVWLGDTPIAVLKKNAQGQYQTFYVHADHLNTPRAILDSQNRTVWKWNSNAFGQGLPEEDPDGDGTTFEYNSRFPGQYFDKETGLHYNGARDYDPSTGRYPQFDPTGLEGGINGFSYANQNPLRFTDPTGEFAILVPLFTSAAGSGFGTFMANLGLGVGAVGMVNLLCEDDDDRDKKCEKKRKLEEGLCEALAMQWGQQGVKLCKDSAFIRYSECLRFGPNGVTTPLHGVDTPF